MSDFKIAVYNGDIIDLQNPDPAMLKIEVIAKCLSRICRFGAKTLTFYSVAQHCCAVSTLCKSFPLWGLMHDAHEAYIGDFLSPVKRMFPEIKRWEEGVWMPALAQAFQLPMPIPLEVRDADRYMLAYERRFLLPAESKMDDLFKDYEHGVEPSERHLFCMKEEEAEREFLRRFHTLWALR